MTLPADLIGLAQTDARLCAMSRGADIVFALEDSSGTQTIRLHDGEVSAVPGAANDAAAFTIRADDAAWARLLEAAPDAGEQHLLPMLRDGRAALDGDGLAFAQHLQLVRRLIEALRPVVATTAAAPRRPLTMRGSYVRIDGPLGASDVYVERAGSGAPLLCLATAGSDSSQYHGLVTDTDLTDRYEFIAVDLPWHGKSTPVPGVDPADYRLDPASYTQTIIAIVDALGLEQPVLVGPSMAGAAVVRAVALHPRRFAGAVSCQAGPSLQGRSTPALRSAVVNQALHVPEWTYGLMNPVSPLEHRDRVWWGYSSGAYGVYDADIAGYQQWDLAEVEHLLTDESPHIAVLSGAFDTSVPPDRSRALADRIPNASFTLMPELGHFPHAEHPACFARYLGDALERILAAH